MITRKIQINPGWCKGCGICVEFCPAAAGDGHARAGNFDKKR